MGGARAYAAGTSDAECLKCCSEVFSKLLILCVFIHIYCGSYTCEIGAKYDIYVKLTEGAAQIPVCIISDDDGIGVSEAQ